MGRVYFRNKFTNAEYDVIGAGDTEGEIRLKGQHAEFDHPADPEWLKRMGYELIRES